MSEDAAEFTVELVKKGSAKKQTVTLRVYEDRVAMHEDSGKLVGNFEVGSVAGWKVGALDKFIFFFYDEGQDEMVTLTLQCSKPEDIRSACQRLLAPNFSRTSNGPGAVAPTSQRTESISARKSINRKSESV